MQTPAAWGSYAAPGEEAARLRMLFRRALLEHAGDQMKAMQDAILPTFKRHAQGETPRSALDALLDSEVPEGLRTGWFRQELLFDMEDWLMFPDCDGEWGYGVPAGVGSTFEHHAIYSWNCRAITRDQFECEARAQFEAWLKNELDEIETEVKRRRLLVKPSIPGKRNEQHLAWLVYRQVHRWSHQLIATHFQTTRETVKDAVRRLRAHLDLPHVEPIVGVERGGR